MTTLTTMTGMVPMGFFPGEGSELVQPIGQTVSGGLGVGMLMAVFPMPVLYSLFNKDRTNNRIEVKPETVAKTQEEPVYEKA